MACLFGCTGLVTYSAEDDGRAARPVVYRDDVSTPMPAATHAPVLAGPPCALIYDPEQALAHYRNVVRSEEMQRMKAADAVVDAPSATSGDKVKDPRRAHGAPPRRGAAGGKRHMSMSVIMQLRALPSFTPYFIYIITFLQFAVIVAICALAYTQGALAQMGLGTSYATCTVTPASSPPCPSTLQCATCLDTTLRRPTYSNMWYGPNSAFMLTYGALYGPCMRTDNSVGICGDEYSSYFVHTVNCKVNVLLAQIRARECGFSPTLCPDGGFAQGKGVSCCTAPSGQSVRSST